MLVEKVLGNLLGFLSGKKEVYDEVKCCPRGSKVLPAPTPAALKIFSIKKEIIKKVKRNLPRMVGDQIIPKLFEHQKLMVAKQLEHGTEVQKHDWGELQKALWRRAGWPHVIARSVVRAANGLKREVD